MNWREHITVDPNVCHGKPCIKGTRIMAAVVLDCLAADMSHDQILASYPGLSKEMILATLAYSAELAQERVVAA
jgi:uncharacterized protein (DUF433 family)